MHPVTRPLPGTSPRRQGWIFWTALAALSIVTVLILPLFLPPKAPSYSTSYVAGFNNHVAALAVILLSLLTTAFWSRQPAATAPQAPKPQPQMPWTWLLLAAVITLAYVTFLGRLDLQTDAFDSDSAYFLTQLAQWSHFHLKLYRDLEFGYGPLLFAWPAACQHVLGRLGISPEAAYLVSLAALQVLGLAIAFYVVNRLPLRRVSQAGIFLALTIGTMRPTLGLNYTLFRFLSPLAALLFVASRRGKRTQALLFALAQPLMLAISPEIGIAFFAGVLFYAAHQAYREHRLWLTLPVLPLFSGLAFCAWVEKGYFYAMRQFSTGMLNLVVSPTPTILLLLTAAIALAPFAVASAIRRRQHDAASLAGLYGASLALIPAALGLCDNLHTFFNGLGLYMLSVVALDQCPAPWSLLSLAALILIATPDQVQNLAIAMDSRRPNQAMHDAELEQVKQWELAAQDAPIFAPTSVSLLIRTQLMADHRLQPDYFSGFDNAFSPDAEAIKQQELQQASFVLAPAGDLLPPYRDERRRMRLLRLGYIYPVRHVPYIPLKAWRAELLAEFTIATAPDPVTGLTLYRKRSTP